jgi:hypothetical protein
MAKPKVTFKPVRIAEGDWNILAEYPGVEPVQITGFKSKTEVDEWMNGDRRIAWLRSQGYYEPLRHPKAPSLSLTGFRLVVADHALGLPVLRALSLCTCRRQYPGAATGRNLRSTRPAISTFPDMAVGSACTSSFSRLAQRSLALRPAHSRCHQFVTR